jgi:hypothetical protein
MECTCVRRDRDAIEKNHADATAVRHVVICDLQYGMSKFVISEPEPRGIWRVALLGALQRSD